jgi:hypothetical protein
MRTDTKEAFASTGTRTAMGVTSREICRKYPKAVAISIVALLVGCAGQPRIDHRADPDRVQLGRVGVSVGQYHPEYEFSDGSTLGTNLMGLGRVVVFVPAGFALGALYGLRCYVAFFVCSPIFALVGAGKAGEAATKGFDERRDALSIAERRLLTEPREVGIPQKLRDALTEYVQHNGNHAVVMPTQTGPETLSSLPDYGAIRDDADTVLEIGITRIKAEATSLINYVDYKNYTAAFHLSGRVRVVSTKDGRVLEEFEATAETSKRKIEEWIERDGAPVSEAIEISLKEIAKSAVDRTLLIHRPGYRIAPAKPETDKMESDARRPDAHLAVIGHIE